MSNFSAYRSRRIASGRSALEAGGTLSRHNALQIFIGVPRVWEKLSERMKEIGASTKGLKKKALHAPRHIYIV